MTKIFDFKTEINKDELEEAAQSLKKGKLVIFPTETVYGIGANALDSKAVDDIFIAKGRANDNPLIVHISDFSMLDELVEEPSELEKKLMDAFMPGPFTLILKKKDKGENDIYYIYHKQPTFGAGSSTMTIAKFSDFLSDEGNQWAMSKGSYIETDNGITQITISK